MSPIDDGRDEARLGPSRPTKGWLAWIHGAWAVTTLLVLVDLTFTRPTVLSRDWGPVRQYFPDLPTEGVLGYGGTLLAIWGLQTLVEMALALGRVFRRESGLRLGRELLCVAAALVMLALAAAIFFASTFVG